MLPVNFPNKETIKHAWARQKCATSITFRRDGHKTQVRRPVDYKFDNAGVGVYFIVGKDGRGVTKDRQTNWEEIYKLLPSWLRPGTRVPEDAHNIDGRTGRFARDQREGEGG